MVPLYTDCQQFHEKNHHEAWLQVELLSQFVEKPLHPDKVTQHGKGKMGDLPHRGSPTPIKAEKLRALVNERKITQVYHFQSFGIEK